MNPVQVNPMFDKSDVIESERSLFGKQKKLI
jgi:hypothetical protein